MPKQAQTPQPNDDIPKGNPESAPIETAVPAKKNVVIKSKAGKKASVASSETSNTVTKQVNDHSTANPATRPTNGGDKATRKPVARSYQWVLSDLIFIAAVGLSFYLVIIFAGYSDQDPGFVIVDNVSDEIANYGGRTGAWLSSFLLYIFGVFGYLLPIGITIGGWMTLKHPAEPKAQKQDQDYTRFLLSLLGVLLLISSGAAMSNLFMAPDLWLTELPFSSGGVWGYSLSNWLVDAIDLLATTLVLLGVWAWSLSLLLNRSWMSIFEVTGEVTEKLGLWLYHQVIKSEKTRQVFEISKNKLTPNSQPSNHVSRNTQGPGKTNVSSSTVPTKASETQGFLQTTKRRVGRFFSSLLSGPKVSTQHHDLSANNVAQNNTNDASLKDSVSSVSIDAEKAKQLVSSLDQQETGVIKAQTQKAALSQTTSQDSVTVDEKQIPSSQYSAEPFHSAASANNLDQTADLGTEDHSDTATQPNTSKTQDIAETSDFSVDIGQRSQSPPAGDIQQKAELPSLSLLAEPPQYEEGYTEEELTDLSYKLEQSLGQFGIKVSVESVQPGPVVTRFEILPAPGIKVSKINNLSKDLARVMMVESVRVVEVIVGKSVIGIEIPNKIREVVSFREVLASNAFQGSKSALTIALGKDISGEPIVADIAKMPHLLVAGTTGAGKSVGVNSMILSMLYKSTADEVRMILIDPKMLELSIYEDIPHLLSPVVTDMNDAANALRWCVFEMDRRYELMSKLKVRNMAGFNAKVKASIEQGKPIVDPLHEQLKSYGYEMGEAPPTLEPLPNIVVVIDEFADMIMTVGKEVEQLIARLAQKARAAGIHLILATQRPSVNVITGLIKANIPTRIAFMVNTKIDSRTILEQGGAEQLLGKGDMLYMPPGSGTPVRVHGAFMTDEEVNDVAEFVKSQGAPQYIKAITEAPAADEDGKSNTGSAEDDPLYDEIVAFITEKRKVSVSLLQRHFSIGYNRSARIVEGLEAAGLISAGRGGNNVREVLVPKRDEFDE